MLGGTRVEAGGSRGSRDTARRVLDLKVRGEAKALQ